MAAAETNARVVVAPPPPNWTGDVTALFALLQTNLGVKNPVGWNSFATGTVAPSSDQGPWLKNGTEWYVWNSGTSTYVPQTLNSAFAASIGTGTSLPVGSSASGIFFLVFPGIGVGLYYWTSGAWKFVSGTFAGTTAQRLVTPPPYTQFFDTTIGTQIFYKPGFGWVTTNGTTNDVKMVSSTTESDALNSNPGWEVFLSMKGRSPAGANGAFNGFTDRNPANVFGAENATLVEANLPPHSHGLFATNLGASIPTPYTGTIAQQSTYSGDFAYVMGAGTTPATQGLSGNGTGTSTSFSVVPPTYYLIFLRKVQ